MGVLGCSGLLVKFVTLLICVAAYIRMHKLCTFSVAPLANAYVHVCTDEFTFVVTCVYLRAYVHTYICTPSN